MRHLRVAPGAGEQDDLGWGELQDQISAWEMKLLAEMQYPKQLAILATLNELREQAALVNNLTLTLSLSPTLTLTLTVTLT